MSIDLKQLLERDEAEDLARLINVLGEKTGWPDESRPGGRNPSCTRRGSRGRYRAVQESLDRVWRSENIMRPIRYKVRDPVWASSIDGEPSRLLERSYTPTLTDAKRWSDTPEKFIFVLDLLGLSLTDDGDAYVGGKVEAVEDAFDRLLELRCSSCDK